MKKPYIFATAVGLIGIGWILLRPSTDNPRISNSLTPVSTFSHAHGLAVDPNESSRLFIATHHGLFLLKSERELFRVGKGEDDYMGFSLHPNDSRIFFTSGHSRSGGNLGFQKSEDGGVSWQMTSVGLQGPVDYHALAVSSVDPNLVAGFYGGLQISEDGGSNWQPAVSAPAPIINLVFDAKVRERLYASTQAGLMMSQDLGNTWQLLGEAIPIIAAAVSPVDNQEIFVSSSPGSMYKSLDGGKNWQKLATPFTTQKVLYFAYDKKTSGKLYLLTDTNTLYKSTDSGANWVFVR